MDHHDIQARLAEATELPELLDAAYDAFAAMLTTIEGRQDPDSRFFVPMVYAAASAANGRDCIIRAPSLPPSPARQPELAGQQTRFENDQAPPPTGSPPSASSWNDGSQGPRPRRPRAATSEPAPVPHDTHGKSPS